MSRAALTAAVPSGNGRATARRALVRWTVRTVRRGWRQQLLVLLPLTVAIAAAIGFASAAYNAAPVTGKADFGTANHFIRIDEPDRQARDADVAAAREWFGTIEVIGHRGVAVPGQFEPLDYRVQDPSGPYSAPLLTLRAGRYPAAPSEVAVTEWVASEFDAEIDAELTLDGTPRTVVGIVENPSDLNDEFVLVPPTETAPVDSVVFLVHDERDHVESFRPPSLSMELGVRESMDVGVAAAVSVLAVAVVALVFVGLLAAAGFVVIAQRRQRQLGMLAAVGATERHLRLAMVANGAVIGSIAAVVGAAAGVGAWLLVEPRLEVAAGYRVDRFDVPWWAVGAGMLLAVLTATGAAWWPARVASRASIVQALSGRPPRPASVHRSAAVAGLLIAIGVAALALPGGLADETSVHWTDVLLVVGGTVAIIIGVLLVCPLAVRLAARGAGPFPIAARLALRDLGRYQARSGAALAAITMALGIPAAIVVSAGAAQKGDDAANLPDNVLIVRARDIDGPFVPEPAALDELRANVDRVTAELGEAETLELAAAIDPELENATSPYGREAASLARRIEDGWRDLSVLYIAEPAVLERYGIDAGDLDPATEFLTVETGDVAIIGVAQRDQDARTVEPLTGVHRLEPEYTSLPSTFVTPEALNRRGWQATASGRWLVQTEEPPTSEQLSAARVAAARGGLTIESRDRQGDLTALRSGATAVGMFLALGVLAMTVGLIRSEATPDLRTLTATGATGATRRALGAVTAAALAALGVVLGAAGAVIVLTVGFIDVGDLDGLLTVEFAALVLGTPLVAGIGGWLLSGRPPPTISRPALT